MFKDSRLVQRCLVGFPLRWISACAVVNGDASVGREAQVKLITSKGQLIFDHAEDESP